MRERRVGRSVVRLILPLCLAAGLLLPGQAGAECGRIRLLNMDPVDWRGGGGGYDVFDATQHVQPVEIRVRKTRGGTCRYKIGISEGRSGLFDPRQLVRRGQRLAYNLYDTAAQTNIVTDLALGGTVIEGQFTAANARTETQTHTYYWLIPPRQMVAGAHGRYSDRLRFRLHEEVGGIYVQRNAQSRRHRTRAPRQVEISLVDTGAPFNANDVSQKLDFGIFSEGRMQGFDLRVRGNTGFRISLQSANRGVMAHDALQSAVPYTCTVDGVPVDLNGRGVAQIASFTGDATVAEGAVYRIEVTVGSLAGTLGGRHRDSVTVTLTAR